MNTPAKESTINEQAFANLKAKKEVKWLSPAETCDICHISLPTKAYFVDGRTKFGPWALMCPACHRTNGVGLGTGFGQKYNSKTKIKIAG